MLLFRFLSLSLFINFQLFITNICVMSCLISLYYICKRGPRKVEELVSNPLLYFE